MILVNGPGRMIGYLGDAEPTADAIHDDYYVTGDPGYLDAEGFLYIAAIAWPASAKSEARWSRT